MMNIALSTPTSKLVSTNDLDELHSTICQVIEPRKFCFVGSHRNAHIEARRLALPRTQIFGVTSTTSVHVRTENLRSVQVAIPLKGAVLASSSGMKKCVAPGEALIHIAGEQLDITWLGACHMVFVRVEPQELVPLILGAKEGQYWKPRSGPHILPLANGLGRTMTSLVNQICLEACRTNTEVIKDHEFDKVLHYILALIVTQKRFINVHELESTPRSPRYLDRAVDFVLNNLDQDISLKELTAVSHMSARTLQRAFACHFGKGPLKFIRDAKLHKVREELLNCSPYEKSVSQIALQWGFNHAGNFAKNYAELFGEKPFHTLQKH
jgi:AraC-like DNA-binding protein